MGVAAAPELRDDLIYLDDRLIRLEANVTEGNVAWFVDLDGTWRQGGWVVDANEPKPSTCVDWRRLPIGLAREFEHWLSQSTNRDRLARSGQQYFQVAAART
jgi:hypothetical protein